MLPRERVFAALELRCPDRVPWGEHSIDHNVYQDFLGRPSWVQGKMKETLALWEGRRDEVVEGYKRDKIELVQALDMDLVSIGAVPPAGYTPTPMERVDEVTWRDGGGHLYRVSSATGNLMPYQRNTAGYRPPTVASVQAQIDALDEQPPEDPDDSRWELVHHVVREMKGTHFINLLTGDLAWPVFGATDEEQWMSLVEQPEVCAKLAELRGRQMLREVRVQAQLGVDGVMPCGDLGSSTSLMASPRIYREMIYPWHQAYVAEAHRLGLKVLKHCCGHVWPIIDELAGVYDAYESIQASAGMDIGELKRRVGHQTCLWGGIWHEHIIAGSVADIEADARYAFSTAATGGGFIMGSTHSLAVGAKPENIVA
ncbi:MAG: hypothetical protein HUU35_08600, partial [Armatimonadetes bacterium]|nr:hypothetical protein [Armatimonadota bacterium]